MYWAWHCEAEHPADRVVMNIDRFCFNAVIEGLLLEAACHRVHHVIVQLIVLRVDGAQDLSRVDCRHHLSGPSPVSAPQSDSSSNPNGQDGVAVSIKVCSPSVNPTSFSSGILRMNSITPDFPLLGIVSVETVAQPGHLSLLHFLPRIFSASPYSRCNSHRHFFKGLSFHRLGQ
jgi:hypothetical protein